MNIGPYDHKGLGWEISHLHSKVEEAQLECKFMMADVKGLENLLTDIGIYLYRVLCDTVNRELRRGTAIAGSYVAQLQAKIASRMSEASRMDTYVSQISTAITAGDAHLEGWIDLRYGATSESARNRIDYKIATLRRILDQNPSNPDPNRHLYVAKSQYETLYNEYTDAVRTDQAALNDWDNQCDRASTRWTSLIADMQSFIDIDHEEAGVTTLDNFWVYLYNTTANQLAGYNEAVRPGSELAGDVAQCESVIKLKTQTITERNLDLGRLLEEYNFAFNYAQMLQVNDPSRVQHYMETVVNPKWTEYETMRTETIPTYITQRDGYYETWEALYNQAQTVETNFLNFWPAWEYGGAGSTLFTAYNQFATDTLGYINNARSEFTDFMETKQITPWGWPSYRMIVYGNASEYPYSFTVRNSWSASITIPIYPQELIDTCNEVPTMPT